jgi:hypothetical protein
MSREQLEARLGPAWSSATTLTSAVIKLRKAFDDDRAIRASSKLCRKRLSVDRAGTGSMRCVPEIVPVALVGCCCALGLLAILTLWWQPWTAPTSSVLHHHGGSG